MAKKTTKKARKKSKPRDGKSGQFVKEIEINWDDAAKIAQYHVTQEELASFFECSVDILDIRCKAELNQSLSEFIRQKSQKSNISLRRRQYQRALQEGSDTMLIWLGKNNLGQRDKLELGEDSDKPFNLSYLPDDVNPYTKMEKKLNGKDKDE